uniref:collagen alpha-2(I) chain-like n=1 Tax=Jaculus jaculus TaxID=51337 RepID=UPI001E1B2E2E|nr:collagen alpha-2(I) chain-like [Jaculus jaculus]
MKEQKLKDDIPGLREKLTGLAGEVAIGAAAALPHRPGLCPGAAPAAASAGQHPRRATGRPGPGSAGGESRGGPKGMLGPGPGQTLTLRDTIEWPVPTRALPGCPGSEPGVSLQRQDCVCNHNVLTRGHSSPKPPAGPGGSHRKRLESML